MSEGMMERKKDPIEPDEHWAAGVVSQPASLNDACAH